MPTYAVPPIVSIGGEEGYASSLIPPYASRETVFTVSCLGMMTVRFIARLCWLTLRVLLWMPKGQHPYEAGAQYYRWRHSRTTAGNDEPLRRNAAHLLLAEAKQVGMEKPFRVLDICTGIGLSVQEMKRVFGLHGVLTKMVGVDIADSMLAIARAAIPDCDFVQGDVTRLTIGGNEGPRQPFLHHSFDAITSVFGLGGVPDAKAAGLEVLRVLRPSGLFVVTDMHQPIPALATGFQGKRTTRNFPLLEMMTYREVTTPLVLHGVWRWIDPTSMFYILPLVVTEEDRQWWGFKLEYFQYEARPWWCTLLPLVPTATIVLRKVRLTVEEARVRQGVLSNIMLQV